MQRISKHSFPTVSIHVEKNVHSFQALLWMRCNVLASYKLFIHYTKYGNTESEDVPGISSW